MKTFICSDIHSEFRENRKTVIDDLPTAEAIIIAGDLSTKSFIVDDVKRLCDKYKEVIMVPGNHEYYGSTFAEMNRILENITIKNFCYLNNGTVITGNTKLVGTTLWFKNNELNQIYERELSDFRYIGQFVKEVYEENKKSVDFLLNQDLHDAVVITHHLPSYLSVPTPYRSSPINRFFVCDMDKMIINEHPRVWIHGHSHIGCDYILNMTRVLCNPMGYEGEINNNFSKNVFIDL